MDKFNKSWSRFCVVFNLLMCLNCCNPNTPTNAVDHSRDDDHKAIAKLYHDCSFYPHTFTLDSNRLEYFYRIFKEKKTIVSNFDTLVFHVFKGYASNGCDEYFIVVLTYKEEKIAIPFNILKGKDLRILNQAFTKLYRKVSPSKGGTKKGEIAMIINKIFQECFLFVRAENPFIVYESTKHRGKNRQLDRKEKNEYAIKSKAYNSFVHNIQDSIFTFRYGTSYVDEYLDDKYLIYIDPYSQVFVVAITDNEVEFRFFNPMNYKHLCF